MMIKMAGFKEAKQLIQKKRNKGTVIALGKTIDGDKYLLIDLEKGKGIVVVFDCGSDVRFEHGIKKTDMVELKLLDKITAQWQKVN